MKWFNGFYILLCIFTLSCGSSAKDEENTAPQSQEPLIVEAPKLQSVPKHTGVFLQTQSGLTELHRGDAAWLQITNAGRGFGFVKPLGDIVSVPATQWLIWTKDLNPATVQLTAMRGVVILPEHGFELATQGNVAWITSESVPTKFEKQAPGDNSMVRLVLDEALKPGFYVIHDQSFLQGVKKGDVTAFYPFVVLPAGSTGTKPAAPWFDAAKSCFSKQFERLETAYEITEALGQNASNMRQCAIDQQLAAALMEKEQEQSFAVQRLILARLANDDTQPVQAQIHEHMDAHGDGFAQWLWWRAQSDVLLELSSLQESVQRGESIQDDSGLSALLSFYVSNLELEALSLRTLIGLPFWIVSDAQSLEGYFAQILRGEFPSRLLLLWVGAYQVKRMRDFAEKNSAFTHRFQFIQTQVPAAFQEASNQVILRSNIKGVLLGPFIFEGTQTPDERLLLLDKVKQKTEAIESCFGAMQRRNYQNSGMLIVELPLSSQLFGREAKATIRDPLAELRKNPIIDDEFTRCAQQSLDELISKEQGLALEPQKVTFGLSFNAESSAPWLR